MHEHNVDWDSCGIRRGKSIEARAKNEFTKGEYVNVYVDKCTSTTLIGTVME